MCSGVQVASVTICLTLMTSFCAANTISEDHFTQRSCWPVKRKIYAGNTRRQLEGLQWCCASVAKQFGSRRPRYLSPGETAANINFKLSKQASILKRTWQRYGHGHKQTVPGGWDSGTLQAGVHDQHKRPLEMEQTRFATRRASHAWDRQSIAYLVAAAYERLRHKQQGIHELRCDNGQDGSWSCTSSATRRVRKSIWVVRLKAHRKTGSSFDQPRRR
jgi:hypothetical protein